MRRPYPIKNCSSRTSVRFSGKVSMPGPPCSLRGLHETIVLCSLCCRSWRTARRSAGAAQLLRCRGAQRGPPMERKRAIKMVLHIGSTLGGSLLAKAMRPPGAEEIQFKCPGRSAWRTLKAISETFLNNTSRNKLVRGAISFNHSELDAQAHAAHYE
jgi:hypothetical protein